MSRSRDRPTASARRYKNLRNKYFRGIARNLINVGPAPWRFAAIRGSSRPTQNAVPNDVIDRKLGVDSG